MIRAPFMGRIRKRAALAFDPIKAQSLLRTYPQLPFPDCPADLVNLNVLCYTRDVIPVVRVMLLMF